MTGESSLAFLSVGFSFSSIGLGAGAGCLSTGAATGLGRSAKISVCTGAAIGVADAVTAGAAAGWALAWPTLLGDGRGFTAAVF